MNRYVALLTLGILASSGQASAQTLESRVAALERRVNTLQSLLVSGTVLFTQARQCPRGFTELIAMRGRYLVGVATSGEVGATVGQALGNKERRNTVGYHAHSIDPAQLAHTHHVEGSRLFYSNDQNGAQDGAHYPIVGIGDTGPAKFKEGLPMTHAYGLAIEDDRAINAPYIQLMACVRSR